MQPIYLKILEYQALTCTDELGQCTKQANTNTCMYSTLESVSTQLICQKTCNACNAYRRKTQAKLLIIIFF